MTLAAELARAAAEAPETTFLRTRAGSVTYAACASLVDQVATRLAEEGIGPDAQVVLVMDNHIEQVVVWLALGRVGALHVPINPVTSGPRLRHALHTCRATHVVADDAYLPGLHTELVGLHEGFADGVPVGPIPTRALFTTPTGPAARAAEREDLADATLLFTSGTTGPPKACALSSRYLVRQGELHAQAIAARPGDVLYCPFPLFHVDAATLTVSAAIAARCTAALGRRFSASGFWDEVRALDASVFNFMGATLTLLWNRDPDPRDREHRVRLAWGVPMPSWHKGFEERFGVRLLQVYGLTDGGMPVYDPIDGPRRPGAAGRVIAPFEVRIDQDRGRPGDPVGAGEILIRGREPGLVMNGYYGDPEATRAAFVDGWVRTGDLGSLDSDGFLTFHGRLTDSIRRRGENITAFDVEELVASHPDVAEVAAFGVPSELTEEDVMVCVVPRAGAALRPASIHAHAAANGPRHLVPRYVRLVDALPRTPTAKVEKFRLRAAGPTPDTWDAGDR